MALLSKDSIYIARELAEIKAFQITLFKIIEHKLNDPVIYRFDLERRQMQDTQMLEFFEFHGATDDYPILVRKLKDSLEEVRLKLDELIDSSDKPGYEPIGFKKDK